MVETVHFALRGSPGARWDSGQVNRPDRHPARAQLFKTRSEQLSSTTVVSRSPRWVVIAHTRFSRLVTFPRGRQNNRAFLLTFDRESVNLSL